MNGNIMDQNNRFEIYKVLDGMARSSSETADSRFYHYLVANSLLLLAWVELSGVFSGLLDCKSQAWQERLGSIFLAGLLVVISWIGAYLAEVFIRFMRRTKTYERHYIAWAALMEYDDEYKYIPKPYLWTNFLREFAEDINSLDAKSKCWRQQEILQRLSKYPFEGLLVLRQRILPAIITPPNNTNKKYEVSDRAEELNWGTKAEDRQIPSASGFKIYQNLPRLLSIGYFFMLLYSIICVCRVICACCSK